MEFTSLVGITASSQLSPSTKIRIIVVPDEKLNGTWENDREQIFEYGQNDFQPANVASLSSGDIVIYNGAYYRVEPIGWTRLRPVQPDNA